MARRRSYTPEQIITKLREAEIYLGQLYPENGKYGVKTSILYYPFQSFQAIGNRLATAN